MSKSKDSRKVAPATKEEATKEDIDWKEMCKDCEILRLYNDCTFGCDMVKASLRRRGKKSK